LESQVAARGGKLREFGTEGDVGGSGLVVEVQHSVQEK
jgi:hypothetical protein